MMIIGCDFHTRYQQIAMMNDAKGNLGTGIPGQTARFPNNLRVSFFIPKLPDGVAQSSSCPLFPYP
jgi:hypothetical protein